MSIFLWLLIGMLNGSFARAVMPGPTAGGFPVAIAIGVLGALVGGAFGVAFAAASWSQVEPCSILFALLGSLAFLLFYRAYALRLTD